MVGLARGLRPSSYRREWLARDVVAGIVLSTLLVPQGMAYAELAGLPPITAFLGVALLGVLPGIAIAVGLSILNVFRRAWWPYDTELGRVDGPAGYHDVHTHPDAQRLPGLVIYRFDGPLFFANATTFRDEVRRMARADPAPRWILIAAPHHRPTPLLSDRRIRADRLPPGNRRRMV